MVRISLMARRIFPVSRRGLLAGLGASALGLRLSSGRAATGPEPLLLRAKVGSIALQAGAAAVPVNLLDGPTGPALRLKRGSLPEIALQNDLPGAILLNWHGLDGIPAAEPLTGQTALAAGVRASFALPLRHAGTLFIGLLDDGAWPSRAIPLIVEEADAPVVDRDEVILIEDFRLSADGTAVPPGRDAKDTAAIYLVNGLLHPDIAVHSKDRLRLRFINACQRHVIAVKIDGLEVRVMAIDGQPAEPFSARNSALVLAPGGRADAFVDAATAPGATSPILLHDGKEAHEVARLVTSREPPARSMPLPPAPALSSNGLPARLDLRTALRVDLPLAGPPWAPAPDFTTSAAPAFQAKSRRVVVLALQHTGAIATTFHLHGHHFRLLDRLDDGWKPYWLDTLAIEPGQTERIAFGAEYPGRWLLESTAADWAAQRLLRWYSVE